MACVHASSQGLTTDIIFSRHFKMYSRLSPRPMELFLELYS